MTSYKIVNIAKYTDGILLELVDETKRFNNRLNLYATYASNINNYLISSFGYDEQNYIGHNILIEIDRDKKEKSDTLTIRTFKDDFYITGKCNKSRKDLNTSVIFIYETTFGHDKKLELKR